MVVTIVEVGISDDDDEDEYSAELIRFSFVIETELNNDSVDSELVVVPCVYRIVFSVVPVETVAESEWNVGDGEEDDSLRVATVSVVIDWLFELVTSLFVETLEDEMVLNIDICVMAVEVKSLLVLTEECVNNTVSEIIVEDIDGYIELLTVVIGWTDEVSKIDIIKVELWSDIAADVLVSMDKISFADDNGRDEVSVALIEFILLVLETGFVSEINSVLVLVKVDDFNIVVFSVTVAIDTVDNSFACSIEESVWCSDIWGVDVIAVEVNSAKDWVIVLTKEFVMVSLVEIGDAEDMEEYSVGLDKISFVVEKVFDEVTVDSALVVVEKVCVYSVVVSIGIVGSVEVFECDDDDDPVELIMVSVVIDWLVDVGISLFVVALVDEILFVSLPILLLLDSK